LQAVEPRWERSVGVAEYVRQGNIYHSVADDVSSAQDHFSNEKNIAVVATPLAALLRDSSSDQHLFWFVWRLFVAGPIGHEDRLVRRPWWTATSISFTIRIASIPVLFSVCWVPNR
jgi:hypothetical protein